LAEDARSKAIGRRSWLQTPVPRLTNPTLQFLWPVWSPGQPRTLPYFSCATPRNCHSVRPSPLRSRWFGAAAPPSINTNLARRTAGQKMPTARSQAVLSHLIRRCGWLINPNRMWVGLLSCVVFCWSWPLARLQSREPLPKTVALAAVAKVGQALALRAVTALPIASSTKCAERLRRCVAVLKGRRLLQSVPSCRRSNSETQPVRRAQRRLRPA
jgi:hypothetical protein